MQEILSFEADRRAINITVNSFGTDLSKDERAKLYPDVGRLYPYGTMALRHTDDIEGVKLACDCVVEYRSFFEQTMQGGGIQKSLEDHFFEREAQLNKNAFLEQVQYASGVILTCLVSFWYCICILEITGAGNTVCP